MFLPVLYSNAGNLCERDGRQLRCATQPAGDWG
jgi:hypothetical protein